MKSRIMKPFCKSLNYLSSKLKNIINLKIKIFWRFKVRLASTSWEL